MNTELTLALKIVQDAGYKVTEPVKEPEKFIPFKGQIVSAWDSNRDSCVTVHFLRMEDDCYICSIGSDLDDEPAEIGFAIVEPIPGLVQMEPYDSSYTGEANVLFNDGRIVWYRNADAAINGKGFQPVFFQKLGEYAANNYGFSKSGG